MSILVVLGGLGLVLLLICAVVQVRDAALILCCALPLVMVAWWLNRQGSRAGIWLFLAVNIAGVLFGTPVSAVATTAINPPLLFVLPPLLAAIFLRPRLVVLVMAILYGAASIQLAQANVALATIAVFVAFAVIDTCIVVVPTLVVLAHLDRALHREATANQALRALNASLDAQVIARTREATEANEELERVNLSLQEANARKAQWLDARRDQTANVAHDQKAELTRLLAAVDDLDVVFANYHVPVSIQSAYETQVHASVDGLDRLISALMTAAQLESHALALDVEELDVCPLVDLLVRRMRPVCERDGVALQCNDIQAPLVALADAVQLERMLANLIDNARKYHRRHDVASQHDTPRIWVDVRRYTAGTIAISVIDNGPGIANVARVRQRWGRGQTAVPGTGLGLSLCAALAQEMGGRLDLASTLGAGTTATIVLPTQPSTPGPKH